MNDAEREVMREYAQRWQRVGPELEKIRRRELREYDFEKKRGAVASLFQLAADFRVSRKSSGLVDWYRRLGVGR